MRIVLDALSVTNLSGRHVVGAHVRHLPALLGPETQLIVLHHAANRDLNAWAGEGIRCLECPPLTQHWTGRALWERWALPGVLSRQRADALVMASGMALPGSPVPQVVLPMNPWCFVPAARRGAGAAVKAWLQRRAYRRTVRDADGIAYLSAYLRDAYHANAGAVARRDSVAYTSLATDLPAFGAAPAWPREPGSILCVSALAPHKGVDTLIDSLALVRATVPQAKLTLAGAWPDPAYERRMRRRMEARGVQDRVRVTGHLDRAQLLREYAQASVFALFSCCESFGIPGLEAQAFGTPVVCSQAGAMPEVYGAGGVTVPVGAVAEAAAALARVLSGGPDWERLSQAARANARRFEGASGSVALAGLLKAVAGHGPVAGGTPSL